MYVCKQTLTIIYTRKVYSQRRRFRTGGSNKIPETARRPVSFIRIIGCLLTTCTTDDIRNRYMVRRVDMQAVMSSDILELTQYCHAVLQRMNRTIEKFL